MASEKRLIDANTIPYRSRNVCGGHGLYYKETIADKEDIDSLPTVEALPVVHGRWEQIGEADYKCPVCGFRFTSCDPIEMFEYCRCGTKMDGDRYV